MRSHLLLALLLSALSFPACDAQQPVEPVETSTYTITLNEGVSVEDITKTSFTSAELETIRLGLLSGDSITLNKSEYARLKEYAEVVKGTPDTDPAVTTFIGQLNY